MKYAVDFNVYTLYTAYVEADSEEDARKLAENRFIENKCPIEDENIDIDIYELEV